MGTTTRGARCLQLAELTDGFVRAAWRVRARRSRRSSARWWGRRLATAQLWQQGACSSQTRTANAELGRVFATASRIRLPCAAHNCIPACGSQRPWPGIFAGQGRCVRVDQSWGGWGSNPRPTDYESAAGHPRPSLLIPARPVLPAHRLVSGISRDHKGQPGHGTGIPRVFPGGRWSR